MFWNVNKSLPACSLSNCITLTRTLATVASSADSGALLGYNEPDGVNVSAQANMTVGQAVEFWGLLSATNRRLGSPVMFGDLLRPNACANNVPAVPVSGNVTINISNDPATQNNVTLTPGTWDPAGGNITGIWLDNFLYQLYLNNQDPSKAKVRFPDFIAVHWYGQPDATRFLNYLTGINSKYHLNIWVTEYSCADWAATCCTAVAPYSRSTPLLSFTGITQGSVHTVGFDWSYPTDTNINSNATSQFMVNTVRGMNSMPFVERFSWKERNLLIPPGNTFPAGGVSTNYDIESSANPDYMGQSALFASFEHLPTALPDLTPLGRLYASL